MKLPPPLPALWFGFLLLWISQGDGSDLDICMIADFDYEQDECGVLPENSEAVICVLYPTNILNCSWALPTLRTDAELSVSVRVLKNEELVDSRDQDSAKRVGSISWMIHEGEGLDVEVQLNLTRNGSSICCIASFEEDSLKIMPPPANVTASIQHGILNITWDVPGTMISEDCFDYQIDLGDQKQPRNISKTLQHTEPTIVLGKTYRVRMRTRVSPNCFGCNQWSEWSPTVEVEQPSYSIDPLIITGISLGIPMILLAVLLSLRHQRLFKFLFPPIPHPPAKYKHFLEKNDPFSFFHPVPTTKHEEEITEVLDAQPIQREAN
ncbi:uncharacterized protein LOC119779307 [Cyprinodon tularosa]|uniref:uncharacterized protein LOC119779307 n=1 Tax=Cyprinodon tularosa TaxID=77115 RepID=UPI0018E27674|nr:uncharacterized protein LOC119779307 [Cyprinodon tularosa]XP_038134835.1 uncharacterized protein LOC119779307 [Cyprinodon tularosa]